MKDEFFAADPNSPLTRRQRARFHGLAYFPPNPILALEADLEPSVGPDEEIALPTSRADRQSYRRVGVASFDVDGVATAVTLLHSTRGAWFVPFRDETSRAESYLARYLEAVSLSSGRVLLDFNYAYNPYCAYNMSWRCPLPPPENRLAVPIRAGEMRYWDVELPEIATTR